MKLLHWIRDNILFALVMALLFVIPLYPKRPLLDVINTWVYIRLEDFIVLFAILVWIALFFMRKVTLKTPLTIPILLFWAVGGIATIHGVLIVFPQVADVFPNLALFSYLRHIEYVFLFYIAFAAMRSKKLISAVVAGLTISFLLVIGYGLGQKYFGFPAYLTMNEEFAKGFGIQLSALSRVPSTFGGHYDFAAYLVLVVPILVSLIVGVRNWFLRIVFALCGVLGFWLMYMTVSRVSFVALVMALFAMFFFYKKKLALYAIPFIAGAAVLFIAVSPALLDRFGSTVNEVDVLIDQDSGRVIGHPVFVTPDYFEDKTIVHQFISKPIASSSGEIDPTLILDHKLLSQDIMLITDQNQSTGEELPAGTGYINLSLSPNEKRVAEYFLEDELLSKKNYELVDVFVVHGDYLLKKALAYDLSFTTRFQGGWPKAMEAFQQNIILGSGYSSAGLAIDNNYLRILAETGVAGLISFALLLITIGVYIKKVYPHITSPVLRSFVIGYSAGVIGLVLNATLIDVFEASKVAFYLWLLTGIVLGSLALYEKKDVSLFDEIRAISTSVYAVIVYLLVLMLVLYLPMLPNYFTGDDFTWLRWVADCGDRVCGSFTHYMTHSEGFFYRPGTKMYFYVMYQIFWLNQTAFHMVSLALHFITAVLVFLLGRVVFKNLLKATTAALIFVLLSGFSEAIFWISSTGFLFNAVFALTGLLLFIYGHAHRHLLAVIGSVVCAFAGMLFHEVGVVSPLLYVLYVLVYGRKKSESALSLVQYMLLALPIGTYLVLRIRADSHWFSGDYSYNPFMLPFNAIGNMLSYSVIMLVGPMTIPFADTLRVLLREHIVIALCSALIGAGIAWFGLMYLRRTLPDRDKRLLMFGGLFTIITLLPFLGLGAVTSRYSYLASVGFVFIIVYGLEYVFAVLKEQGKEVARLGIIVIFCVFSLLHIIQIQRAQQNWFTAGEIVTRFFRSVDLEFENYWRDSSMDLYFAQVPIRHGDAWVFPVGIDDGLWFKLYNPAIRIHQVATPEEALGSVSIINKYQQAYAFTDSGELIDLKNPLEEQVNE